jgi:hypothetical protein
LVLAAKRRPAHWHLVQRDATGEHLTAAGWWYAFLGVFRFVLFPWYFRLVVWYIFLWWVSRLLLRLKALHPDRPGGLGFLAISVHALTPLLVAHSVTIAGAIGNRIWHEGATLPAFQQEILGVVLMLMAIVLLPMTFFIGTLARTKRQGTREYGGVAMEYVDDFHVKWMHGKPPAGEQLVGSADIQSLADLGNSFEVVRKMRLLPFDRHEIVTLAISVALPFAPLVLTMFRVDELIGRLVTKII